MTRLVPFVAVLSLLGCSLREPDAPPHLETSPMPFVERTPTAAPPAPARITEAVPAVVALPAEDGLGYVAWTLDDTNVTSHWLARGPDGHRVLARRSGRWLEIDGSEWEIRVEPTTVRLPGCARLLQGFGPDAPGSGHGERVVAERVLPDGTGHHREQHTIAAPPTDAADVDHRIVGIHLIGDTLLVEALVWRDPCGTMPTERHETVAFSLSRWQGVEFDPTPQVAPQDAIHRAAATLDLDPSEPVHLGIGAVRPRFDAEGELRAEYVVTVTPGLESLAPWTEGSTAMTITTHRLPVGWAVPPAVPESVRSFARATEAKRVLGFAPTRSAPDSES